jgi:hypothetical protein
VNPNIPVRIQTVMRRGVISLLAAAGTLGAAALAWSAPGVASGAPRPPATVSQTPVPSPGQDDYCRKDPNWYLCQNYHPDPIVAAPDSTQS